MKHSTIILPLLFLLMLLSCVNTNKKDNKQFVTDNPVDPFSQIEFDKAIAYDFPGNTMIPLIDSNGMVTKVVTKQVVLDSNQINEFRKILMDSTSFGELYMMDFYPHFGIVFYKNDKIIDHLEVSLICFNVFASFTIPEKEKKDHSYNALTPIGVNKIFKFCKKLGFTQYLDSVKLN